MSAEKFEMRDGEAFVLASGDAEEAKTSVEAVRAFLRPRSVAVVGASRRRGTIGGEVFHNLLEGGFTGPVYPVNPTSAVVQSVAAYPSIEDVPGEVDLAVIVVPARYVLDVTEQCGRAGVKALLIISAGFAETGDEGKALQDELLRTARSHGMRIIGPNCMGIMNTEESARLNASFSPVDPGAGRLAFSSQSGALGIAIMDRTRDLGLGMSSFVSVGNKADISGNDLLRYWEQDENTDVVLLYLESFGNPRKFARIARRMSRTKPIVAVKSGRSEAGARAAASHTAALAGGDIAVDALFRQAGVVRTDTLEELFDVAALLAYQPLPQGRRVAILTNAGGLGILCADACEASGLVVPPLSEASRAELRSFLPDEASVGNPVDMIASASAEEYARALQVLDKDEEVDAVIVIFIPPLVTRAEDVADALMEVAAETEDTTILSCFLGVHGIHERFRKGARRVIPSYSFPESAARALARVARYSEWRQRPVGSLPVVRDERRDKARSIVKAALERRGPGWLEPDAVEDLLAAYGISSARSRVVEDAAEAGAVAGTVDGPVALKVVSRTIVHKSDVGGVVLDLEGKDEVEKAARDMLERLAQHGLAEEVDGLLVQEMVPSGGAELFVGMTVDPSFGPLVACGAGGTLVELMKDVAIRITPLSDLDAEEMLKSLRTYPLFEGYRGSPPLDEDAMIELLLGVGALVDDVHEIAELDLNPVMVFERGKGCRVVDARVRVAPDPDKPIAAKKKYANLGPIGSSHAARATQ